jgi:uncharacterized protein YaaN involved in tellurite resistance
MSDAPVTVKTQSPPAIDAEIESQAVAVVDKVKSALTSPLVVHEIDAVGRDEQRELGDAIDLLATRAVDLQALKGEEGAVARSLTDFRQKMDRLNPHPVERDGFGRVVSLIPIVGPMIVNWWNRSRLRQIATEYQPIKQQINAAMASLFANKDRILENNISLTTLYGRVQKAHQGVLRSIAVGEHVRTQLVTLRDQTSGASEREKLDLMVNRVNVRIQDLRTMEQVDLQEQASMNITVSNNIDLADAIERTVTVVRPLMAVGLAIQAALADQKRAIEAVKATQEYAGDLLVANAEAIGRQTEEVGNLTQSATIALAKVEDAHRKVMAAIDKADEIRRAGSKTAEEASAKLKQMSAALLPKVEKLEAARKTQLEM